MSFYAIQLDDGRVAVMQTVGDIAPEACIAKWPDASRQHVLETALIDPGQLPVDRTFRNAWTLDRGAVAIDMAKARAIKRDQLRAERAPRLAALDEAYLRADEVRDDAAKATIAAEKEKLRSATDDPAIDAAATPEELKAITLDQIDRPQPVSNDATGKDADPISGGG
jgi:hypothetical protein